MTWLERHRGRGGIHSISLLSGLGSGMAGYGIDLRDTQRDMLYQTNFKEYTDYMLFVQGMFVTTRFLAVKRRCDRKKERIGGYIYR